MKIVGCDLHARQQSIAMLDTETGEFTEKIIPLGQTFEISPLGHLLGGVDIVSQIIKSGALTVQDPYEIGISWPFAANVTSPQE